MGKVCTTMEGMKIPREEDKKGDGLELSLELSIGGGRYGKSENSPMAETRDPISRSGFSFGCGSGDPHRRREIQAAKRQEARHKREEKLKKSSMADDGNRLCLETRRSQSRVRDREAREREGFSEGRERNKTGVDGTAAKGLSLSLCTENNKIPAHKMEMVGRGCLFPTPASGNPYGIPSLGLSVGGGERNDGNNAVRSVSCMNRNRNLSLDCDSEYSNNGVDDIGSWKLAVPNRSLVEQGSSAVSDYPTTSHKGGSSSETGSHSSPYIYRNALDHAKAKSNDSSTQAKLEKLLKSEQTNNTCSPYDLNQASSSMMKETGVSPIEKHPSPPNNNNSLNLNLNAAPGPRNMPCVSATGNGPHGRTVTGFLYKYNQTEVIIMCVCHRSLFSPAEFVEHAGGVDVLNPLRHITMIAHP
ncbi:hypothetical protein ABFX02_14G057200 [Erythranthe guttata]